MTPAPSRDFPQRLVEHERERHASLLAFDTPVPRSSLPPGWRPEDVLRPHGTRGFLPLADAAEQMKEAEPHVVDLVRRGLLLAENRGGLLYVQPAIVGVTRVTRR